MINAEQYSSLIDFAKFYLRNKPHLQAEDLVNDILLEMIESKVDFTLPDAEKRLKSHHEVRAKTTTGRGKDFSKNDTERVCKRCKELLPVAMFRIHELPTSRVLGSYCSPCANIKTLEHQKTERGKELLKKRQAKYRLLHPKKVKEIQNRYDRKRRKGINI